ncbi:hypothetical protein NBO_1451g0001 [Nosema bombycis CQ1]|uniref:Uncharacterized protein n=1 Tax=Nosema bombycis (strain CQ1 / CVCC 102059) TaxID=578461 RepID=R0KKQ8_NOSB1|nr:hypothetical protein NBO_1451g0001 [Nosema bombycis CQ1]|eukprot:EOB11201.1 hypothetical protein NBO_1451g0001 [Nosema bombycis CQ1]
MREFHKILDVTAVKPNDWVHDSRIVCKEDGPAKILTSFTQEEKHLIFKRKILVVLPKRNIIRRNRFSEEDKDIFWLIKDKEGRLLGPFTSKEMQNKASEGGLKGLSIKRDDDKDFIEYDKISKDFENVFDLSSFEKFLTKGADQRKEEQKPQNCLSPSSGSRYDILFVDEDETQKPKDHTKPFHKNQNDTKNVFNVENGGTFTKSKAFLKNKNCQIDVQNIIQRIYGKTRTNAINVLSFLSSTMNKQDCEQLIDFLVNESGKEILADSSDGFIKVFKKNLRK